MATISQSLVITKQNNTTVTLPYPQELSIDVYDVDAATTGRDASGHMFRDRVAVKRKINCKWAALTSTDLKTLLNAVTDASFTLTLPDPLTETRMSYTVYVGDRSAPVYWWPTTNTTTWMYASLSMNFIEM